MTDEPHWFTRITPTVLGGAGPGKKDRVGVDLLKGERPAVPGDRATQDLYEKAEDTTRRKP